MGLHAESQERFRSLIDGVVTNIREEPVPYVHVIIPARNEGAVGNFEGRFQIAAYPGDTLKVSSVSFKDAFVSIPDTLHASRFLLEITLLTDTTILSEITVYPWPGTWPEFEREFLDLRIAPMAVQDLSSIIFLGKELKNIAYPSGGIGFPGPASLLYNLFGKKPRSERLLRRLLAEDFRKEQVTMKYNPMVIAKVTGIMDPEEIKAFREYCPLMDAFVLQASEYELYKAILDCYLEFR